MHNIPIPIINKLKIKNGSLHCLPIYWSLVFKYCFHKKDQTEFILNLQIVCHRVPIPSNLMIPTIGDTQLAQMQTKNRKQLSLIFYAHTVFCAKLSTAPAGKLKIIDNKQYTNSTKLCAEFSPLLLVRRWFQFGYSHGWMLAFRALSQQANWFRNYWVVYMNKGLAKKRWKNIKLYENEIYINH